MEYRLMWSYAWNNPNAVEDGFILFSPADREVGIIDNEADVKEIVEMLNEALTARQKKQ